jgi:hypothetical protein
MLQLKLQSTVLVTAFGSRSRRIKKEVYIPLFIGDDCFEHVLLVSGQLIESLLIGADLLQEYGMVVNFETNCLKYEMEGNMKECKFTDKAEAGLEPQDTIGHGLQGTVAHDVMQTMHDESVWTVRKYVTFINRNRELHDEVMEEEISPLDMCEKGWEEKYPMCELITVLRENMDDAIEFNACDKADDSKGKRGKEDLVDYVHQGSGGQSKLRMDLCETGKVDSRDQQQASEVDLEKLIMSNNNLEGQQREKLIEVIVRYTELLTTRPGKCKVYE